MRLNLSTLVFLLLITSSSLALGRPKEPAASAAAVCSACVRADLDFLASDELHGRGSGTRDEHLAALFAASLFQSFGLEPAGEHSSYIQRAPLPNPLPE